MRGSLSLNLRPTTARDLAAVTALERASYPSAEAASAERLASRLSEAGDYFRTMVLDEEEVVGFICGTRCDEFTEEAMATHDPSGRLLAIHSVVVDERYRRRGLASTALKWYLDEVDVTEVRLIAKANLLGLYSSGVVGFEVCGVSKIVHGSDAWFDCRRSGVDLVQVDAFSGVQFAGNPAAVVFRHGDDEWMQAVANENNLAETAFLRRTGETSFEIRWFTPQAEVDLCGHATLAAAEALFATGRVFLDRRGPDRESRITLTFETRRAGTLKVSREDSSPWLSMDLPTSDIEEVSAPPALRAAIGGNILFCGRGPATTPDWFVEVDDVTDVRVDGLRGDQKDFVVPRGVVVTSRLVDPPYDFVSRFFAPNLGIPEDPVTGSAHALLTKYWETKLNKSPLLAKQASKRTGVLKVHTTTSAEGESRTIVQGQATLVLTARLM
eukprot:CAMPEP_0118910954 /NCGR_PEP_ID=MMETSP1166-20130328/12869_1 /TAXON_ID=1104430 /ORGANISM="Chrysoreinhardia sp, Strain CCMP3193" /LENGTH=440 /DNA_ID=CAMNT_0006850429 /DNA_START=43 /DNA_END=1365 /DNA_ORIENTATION=+